RMGLDGVPGATYVIGVGTEFGPENPDDFDAPGNPVSRPVDSSGASGNRGRQNLVVAQAITRIERRRVVPCDDLFCGCAALVLWGSGRRPRERLNRGRRGKNPDTAELRNEFA